jgi:hypothetical protein
MIQNIILIILLVSLLTIPTIFSLDGYYKEVVVHTPDPYRIIGNSVVIDNTDIYMNVTPLMISPNDNTVTVRLRNRVLDNDATVFIGYDNELVSVGTVNVNNLDYRAPKGLPDFGNNDRDYNVNNRVIDFEYQGMERWNYLENIELTRDDEYELTFELDIEDQFTNSGKYTICIAPNGYNDNMLQARDAEELYCLDPWWNLSFAYRRDITNEPNVNFPLRINGTSKWCGESILANPNDGNLSIYLNSCADDVVTLNDVSQADYDIPASNGGNNPTQPYPSDIRLALFLDVNSTTVANDSSTYANHAFITTPDNLTWTEDDPFKSGTFEFNGDINPLPAAGIEVPFDSSLNLTTELTVSGWIKLNTNISSSVGSIFMDCNQDAVGAEKKGWIFGRAFGAGVNFPFIVRNGTNTTAVTDLDFFQTYNNTWTHIVGTYSGGKHLRLYINGQLEDEKTSGVINQITYWNASYNYNCSIGRRSDFKGHGVLDGSVGEAIIWSRALNATEVEILYNSSLDQYMTLGPVEDTIPTHGTPILNATTIYNYTIDDLTVYNVSTESSAPNSVKNIQNFYLNDKSITLVNMPFEGGSTASTTQDFGAFGKTGSVTNGVWEVIGGYDGFGAYDFTSGYVKLEGSDDLDSDYITITAWVYRNSTTTSTRIATKSYYYSGPGLTGSWQLAYSNNGSVLCTINSTNGLAEPRYSVTSSNESLPLNTWKHIACRFDGSSLKIFVDGSEDSSWPTATTTIAQSNYNITLGSSWNGTHTQNSWTGKLDDVKIYNRSLSAGQILALYENRTDLIVSDETVVGEVWNATVTPVAGQGQGITKWSNTVTITQNPVAPVVTLDTPADSYNGNVDNLPFNCSATDLNNNLQNITLYIWNSTTLEYNDTQNITGGSDMASWNITLTGGSYTWNCLAYDAGGLSDWATNFTLTANAYRRELARWEDKNDVNNKVTLFANGEMNMKVLDVLDTLKADGSTGVTDSSSYWLCTAADCSTSCQVNIKKGLIVGCT